MRGLDYYIFYFLVKYEWITKLRLSFVSVYVIKYTSVCSFVCLSVFCLSLYQSTSLLVNIFLYLYIFLHLSIYLSYHLISSHLPPSHSINLPASWYLYRSIYISLHLSISHLLSLPPPSCSILVPKLRS